MEETNTSVVKPKQKKDSGNVSFLGNISSTTVHIVVEALAFVVLYLNFNSKISRLTKELTDLREELDEQEETIQRHEEILKKLVGNMQHTKSQTQYVQPAHGQQPIPYIQTQPIQAQAQPIQVQAQPIQVQAQAQPIQVQAQPIQVQAQPIQVQPIQANPPVQHRVHAPVTPSITEIKPVDLDAELQEELSEMNKSVATSS